MRGVAIGLMLASLGAGCATGPQPTTDLRLIGVEPAGWGGTLTDRNLAFDLPGRGTVRVESTGFPCPEPEKTCFFGGSPKYVNATSDDGLRFSLTADPQRCTAPGRAQPFPYAVTIYFTDLNTGAKGALTGCGELIARRR